MSAFNDPDMQEIFEGYLIETQELLDTVTPDLMQMEETPEDKELLNRIFRSFHTIKGTSSFMGFDHIAGLTHHAEDLLNKMRRSEIAVNRHIVDVLLDVQDQIQLMIDNLREGDDAAPDHSQLIETLNKLSRGEQTADSGEEKHEADSITGETDDKTEEKALPGESAVDKVLSNEAIAAGTGDFSEDELDLLQQAFAEVNASFSSDSSSRGTPASEEPYQEVKKTIPIDSSEKSGQQTSSAESQESEIKDGSAHDKASPQVHEAAKGKKPKISSETIRIDVARVESLMDLSGELVLGRNRLAQLTEQLEEDNSNRDVVRELIENTAQIDFVTSEIQAAVMRMRMVPVGKLYQKAPRIVRDLSKEFKKNIRLVVKGEETEIDRGIIEELNDPLVHMIRNSCDHGIESPEERKAKGKPEQGTVTLDADQEGNNIVLKISDDGKGMDPEKLRQKAIEKGIITKDQAGQMSDREAYQLIFMPGFSTAAQVSNVSGRGVGMDVVRTNIQHLKGMIDIESGKDKGSTFIIKLPLTLAIIQGLLVKVSNETYAIPLSSVVEVVSLDSQSIYHVNGKEVIRIRQEVLPITRLGMALSSKNGNESLVHKYVVNVGSGMQRVGLVVDELLGQQEIVIKSLGGYLGHIPGIAGSTILGDGRVIMIIDVAELIESVTKNNRFVQFSK
ncbi:MAG: chemotaxis protein CheA [Candidatus Kapaibacterium sp.]